MGPTNIALVQLYRAEQSWRDAERRLEEASRSIRLQERRIADLNERLRLGQQQFKEEQAKSAELDLEVKSRDEKIERLRKQQQGASNLKEYQAFLTEINTEKIDKGKVEDELLKMMEGVEKRQAEIKDLAAQLEVERKKCEQAKQEHGAKLSQLKADVDASKAVRNQAAEGVSSKAMDTFVRLAERFDGEAMAAISKPDRRHEEYMCTACNMALVADVYNRLHSRDDLILCPNCHRLLFIPDDLPPDTAIKKPRERKERREKMGGAGMGRQTSAADISRSITAADTEEPEAEVPAPAAPEPAPEVQP